MEANQNRREFKFVLPPGLAETMRGRVAEYLEPDRGAENGYPILSEYFDCEDRMSYWQKQFGSPNRRRVRSRVYGQLDGEIPPSSFIEVKHKLDGVTVKRRVAVGLEEVMSLSDGCVPEGARSGDARVVSEIDGLMADPPKQPVVQIRYHRYAFDSGPSGTIRITFDVGLKCRFRRVAMVPDDRDFELPLTEPGAAIMEVKTIGPVPYWFRQLIGEYSLVPQGFSKYAVALEKYEFVQTQDLKQKAQDGSATTAQ